MTALKSKRAAALGYGPGKIAPELLAKGRGREAERIIALAREAGIDIVEDAALSALLDSQVKVGDYIPMHCWELVARILAFVLTEEKK
ncbi:MAG: EscU/YscU/HrcU family type III secretion system export apparatus switch protein [Spirochaetaceae bacterium]|jgi:type III secretion system FlhB-like substrate exporter|nr:EscU/YscU/HrcU family type III secretion system export apparatus switch protein [Spirochaetaceae bacterium]